MANEQLERQACKVSQKMPRYRVETVTSSDSDASKNEDKVSPIAAGVIMEEVKEKKAAPASRRATRSTAPVPERTPSRELQLNQQGPRFGTLMRVGNPYHQKPRSQGEMPYNEITPPQQNEQRQLGFASQRRNSENVGNARERGAASARRSIQGLLSEVPKAVKPIKKRKSIDPPSDDRTGRVGRQGQTNPYVHENEEGNNTSVALTAAGAGTPAGKVSEDQKQNTEDVSETKVAEKRGASFEKLATDFTCEECNTDQSLTTSKMFAECKQCLHKNEDKYGDSIWRVCEDVVGHSTVPENSEQQLQAMKVVKDMMKDMNKSIAETNTVKPRDFDVMWTIRDACIDGNLLLRDCNQKPNNNAGLQDEMANCEKALISEDRIAFRKSFLSFMYYMLIGYQHTPANRTTWARKTSGSKK